MQHTEPYFTYMRKEHAYADAHVHVLHTQTLTLSVCCGIN